MPFLKLSSYSLTYSSGSTGFKAKLTNVKQMLLSDFVLLKFFQTVII